MNCPNCGDFVNAIDTLDTEYCGNKYYDRVVGVCPTCRTTWRWIEVYEFTRCEDIEEETGE